MALAEVIQHDAATAQGRGVVWSSALAHEGDPSYRSSLTLQIEVDRRVASLIDLDRGSLEAAVAPLSRERFDDLQLPDDVSVSTARPPRCDDRGLEIIALTLTAVALFDRLDIAHFTTLLVERVEACRAIAAQLADAEAAGAATALQALHAVGA